MTPPGPLVPFPLRFSRRFPGIRDGPSSSGNAEVGPSRTLGQNEGTPPRLARNGLGAAVDARLKVINHEVSIGVSILEQFGDSGELHPLGFMDLAQMTERFPPSPRLKARGDELERHQPIARERPRLAHLLCCAT